MTWHLSETNNSDLLHKTLIGVIWSYIATYSGKFMAFISTIILARLLQQEDFGIVGYALVFMSFLQIVEGFGIESALIYCQSDKDRTNTAFWLGMGTGCLLLGIAWLLAPVSGWFFQDPRAIPIARVLGLTFPIAALGLVHRALLRKELAFHNKFIADFAGAVSKGLTSIILALLGFGAWSLIGGQLIGESAAVIAYWYILRWRPVLRFHRRLVSPLLSYGTHIVSVNVLGVLLTNFDYLLIGRFLGAAALGIYTLAFRIPQLLITGFCMIVSKVMFPAYTTMRNNPEGLAEGLLNTMRYVVLITAPLGLGLALIARPFVLVMLSEKWVEAIPVIRAIALYALFRSFIWNIADVYKAQGRPGLLTKLVLIRAVISLPLLLWVVTKIGSIAAVGWAQAIAMFLGAFLNFTVAGHLLKIPYRTMFASFRPALVGSLFMAPVVLSTLHLTASMPASGQLFVAIIGGGHYI